MQDMNDFDNNMKKQAGAFDMEPRGQVWDRITQELDGKKRNRRFAWLWWLVPLVVAGGGYVIYQTGNNSEATLAKKAATAIEPHTQTPVTNQTTEKTMPETTQHQHNPVSTPATPDYAAPVLTGAEKVPLRKTAPNPSVAKTENLKTETIAISGLNNDDLKQSESSDNKEFQSNITSVVMPESKAPKAEQLLIVGEQKEESKNLMITDSLAELDKKLTANEMGVTIPETKEIAIVSNESISNANTTITTADSLTPSGVDILPVLQSKKQQKGSWQIVGGVGLHNHSGKGLSLQNTMADYNSPLQNNAGGSFSGSMALEPTKPGPGFMIGVERTGQLSKNWSWITGLHYQYQSFNISTGSRIDSSVSLRIENSGTEKSADYFYRPGNSISHTGNQHRAHLLAAIQLHFGRQQKWIWQNGVYGGLVLNNSYLTPKGGSPGWIPANEFIRTGYFGMETGIKFQPGQFGAGLFGQYNLSSSLKASSLPSQYWRGLELRVFYNLSSPPFKK
jgi:hypothetical protein